MDLLSLVAKLSLDSSEYEKGLGDAETKGSTFGRGLKKAAAIGASAVAAVGTAAIAAGTSLVKSTGDVAAYGDNIDKMSQKMGISAQAYQEWDAIMQHSGTSMGAMSGAFKTLQNAMAGPTDEQSMAFKNLGISSEIYAMKTEDAFNLVITKLQEMPESARRTAIAQKLLGRGAMEMGALLNTSAEDTQAMRDRVHELGGVMSDDAVKASAQFQDTLQDMSTGFDSLKRNMLSKFLPAITDVMDGLTNLFTGDYDEGIERISEGVGQVIDKLSEMLPKILEVGKNILLTLGNAIIKNLPVIVPALADFVMSIGQSIIDNLPMLVGTGLQIILQLANSIAQALPTLIPTIVDVVLQIVDTLIDNVDLIVDASIALIIGLTEGIINSLPILIEKTPEIIIAIVDALVENFPKIAEAAFNLIVVFATALIDNLPEIVNAILKIREEISAKFQEIVSQALSWGADLISNFVSSIKAALYAIGEFIVTTWETVTSAVETAMNTISTVVSTAWNAVGTFITTALTTISSTVTNIWSTILSTISIKMDNIKTKITTVWTTIKTSITSTITLIKNTVTNGFTTMVSNLAAPLTNMKTAITGAFNSVENTIKGVIDSAVKWGSDLIDNFVSGIKNNISKVGDAVSGVADKIKSLIGFSEPEDGPLSRFHTFAPDMMELFAQGIDQSAYLVTDALKRNFDFYDDIVKPLNMDGSASSGLTGSRSGDFNETINIYAPTALDPSEVARQTRKANREMMLALRGI